MNNTPNLPDLGTPPTNPMIAQVMFHLEQLSQDCEELTKIGGPGARYWRGKQIAYEHSAGILAELGTALASGDPSDFLAQMALLSKGARIEKLKTMS